MGLNKDVLKTISGVFSVENLRMHTCCDDPKPYSDLRRDVSEDGSEGLIVQMGCHNCDTVFGWMHPIAWLDMYEGNESYKLTDVLKRKEF